MIDDLYNYKCKIVKVVDGDTFDAEIDLGFHVTMKRRVRMLGYNAPEIFGGHYKTKEERDLGMEVKAALEAALSAGEVVLKTQLDEADKYGRVLAAAVVSGKPVNDDVKKLSEAAWEKLRSLYPAVYK